MRVISGKFKGHKLVSFNEDHIRPMTDRVKESVFNIIAPHLEGARVLDLFSGTGSLGIEALSRGAAFVQFVEKDPKSIKVIIENLDKLHIESGVDIQKADVFTYLSKADESYDLILIDPPFKAMVAEKTLLKLSKSPVMGPETTVVIEHSSQEIIPATIDQLNRTDQREYGDKYVSFYRAPG